MGRTTNISRWDTITRPLRRWVAELRGVRYSADASALSPYLDETDFGVSVNNNSAFKLSAFFAGIRLISENIASLPKNVKKDAGDGSAITDKKHAVSRLLHHPNAYTNSMTFWMTIVTWIKGWGNAYAYIKRDPNGKPIELHQIHPSFVGV